MLRRRDGRTKCNSGRKRPSEDWNDERWKVFMRKAKALVKGDGMNKTKAGNRTHQGQNHTDDDYTLLGLEALVLMALQVKPGENSMKQLKAILHNLDATEVVALNTRIKSLAGDVCNKGKHPEDISENLLRVATCQPSDPGLRLKEWIHVHVLSQQPATTQGSNAEEPEEERWNFSAECMATYAEFVKYFKKAAQRKWENAELKPPSDDEYRPIDDPDFDYLLGHMGNVTEDVRSPIYLPNRPYPRRVQVDKCLANCDGSTQELQNNAKNADFFFPKDTDVELVSTKSDLEMHMRLMEL